MSNRPMMGVCSEYEPGYLPKHVDGGQHKSRCVWVFSNGRREGPFKYVFDWMMYHQVKPKSWIVCFTLTMDGILREMSHVIPEAPNGQFYVSEDDANSLQNEQDPAVRRRLVEMLMIKNREQAFHLFENEWVNEQDPPKIEFERQEATM